MFLRELFTNTKKPIAEGGNVSSSSPGWQGAADQEAEEIDLKIHDRDFMVAQLRTLLAAQNESFKAAHGRYIWDPKLLRSGQMFSGSSLTFFDVSGVNTQDFMNKLKKTKVGDIDTQIDQEISDEVTAWLRSSIGEKIGNGTLLGFNSSLSSIWLLDDPEVRVQIDYELGPYDPETKSPTEWFAYSHSSHYDDMAAGIKGVFHKYLNRAMTHAQKSTKYVARALRKGVKISDEPVTDSDYSFAVSSAQGGGMSMKYRPYIDPNTGEPMEKDGIPVMLQVDSKDRDYIQNLDRQFEINFGRRRTEADRKLQGSFVGTLQLMNRAFTPEQNEAVARAFLDILFGPGAQMITKDDPARDRDIKFAAVDAMLLGGHGIKPLKLDDGAALRQEAVKMAMDYEDKFRAKQAGRAGAPNTDVAEDADAAAAAKPNYARQGIKHLYNRLPDGRVSSVEMKDAEFLEIAKEIADNDGTLNGFAINLKVDGAGIRFGKDSAGRPFFMTSRVTTPLYQSDVGYFTSFGQQRGQDAEQLARTKNYDDALALITGSEFIKTLPPDTIVQAEMLYNSMAERTEQGLKFVNIPYDPKRLGKQMTLVPFMIKQFSTGDELPDADRVKKRLLAASDNNIKIISNNLEQKGINVRKIIEPVLNLDPKDKANKPAFDQAKQQLSDAIINNPKLAGKDALGDNMEGIVVNMPSGKLFKVTSQQMKSAMAAKNAPAPKRTGPLKTAVVAIGSFVGHRGHEELFNYTVNKARELGGDPYLFIGNAVGADDPIPPDIKVQTWHKLYPEYANNISYVMQGGSLMQKIKHELINPQPGKPPRYDNIVIMVGEDRKDLPLAGALMKAVNRFPGYEHVKASLEVTPRGTGMSFTKLRNILKDTNATPEQQYALWAQGFDEQKLGKDWILHLMDISRKGMGVIQENSKKAAELIDVDAIHAAALREHIASNPVILENIDSNQVLDFLNSVKTGNPIIGKKYLYVSFSVTPLMNFVDIAHFAIPRNLTDIDNNYAYFDIDGDTKRVPESGKIKGDTLTKVFFFSSTAEFEKVMTALHLYAADYRISKRAIDRNTMLESTLGDAAWPFDTIDETIVKTDGKYRLLSKRTHKNLGTYDTKAGAEKRERQVQYFKHASESVTDNQDPRGNKYSITVDHYGNNRDVPLYTKTYPVYGKSEEEAVMALRKLIGGSNYKVQQVKLTDEAITNPATKLAFRTRELAESQIASHVKQYFECHGIEKPHGKSINNIKRLGNIRLIEDVGSKEIEPFIEMIRELDTDKTVKIGDNFSVLEFEIVFAWKEITVSGFLAPKKITNIKMHSDGTINYIEFSDGDRYPRLNPATYGGRPVTQAAYFDTEGDARAALTALSLKVPESWELDASGLGQQHVDEEAAGVGVIANKKQAKDPRYSMSLTKDVRPGEVERSLKKLRLK